MIFSKFRLHFLIISTLLCIALFSVTFMVHDGFARSISFNGGIRISLQLPTDMNRDSLERVAVDAGFVDAQVRLTNPRLNHYDLELGPDVRDDLDARIRADEASGGSASRTVTDVIESLILPMLPGITTENILSREAISASYGHELMMISFRSLLITVIIITFYLTFFRFSLPYAIGASLAIIHDIVLTIGFIGFMQIQPSVPVVAAVLTIIGYSINDTIVIFDRIREKVQDLDHMPLQTVMDAAITQTLSRTILTSVLTLISVLAIILGGAQTLHDFAVVLLFGVTIGTYSSIFIASHFVQYYEEFRIRFRGGRGPGIKSSEPVARPEAVV